MFGDKNQTQLMGVLMNQAVRRIIAAREALSIFHNHMIHMIYNFNRL